MRSILVFLFAAAIAGCYQLTLEPSDFAWPIETVLNVDEEGFVREERFSFSTNVIPLFTEETGDSLAFNNAEVRIIRDEKGYYYLTSNGFKNVYLFNAEDGKLVLKSSFFVSEFGLDLPAFNQRKPYIEVLDGEVRVVFLNSEGIKGEEK